MRAASLTSRRAADPWNSRCVPPPGGWFLGAALMSDGAPRRLGSNDARARAIKRKVGHAYKFFWNQLTTDFSRLIFFWSCSRP